MPESSTSGTGRTRNDLAGAFFAANTEAPGMIAERVLPSLSHKNRSGRFLKVDGGDLTRNYETRRAPRSGFNRGNFKHEWDTFDCQEDGFEVPIDNIEAEDLEEQVDSHDTAARLIGSVLARNREERVRDTVHDDTVLPLSGDTGLVVPDKFDTANAKIREVILEVRESVRKKTGGEYPNFWQMTQDQYIAISLSADIRDEARNVVELVGSNSLLPVDWLQHLFNIPEIAIAHGSQNTAKPGVAANMADIWSNAHMFFGIKRTGQPGVEGPEHGRTWTWKTTSGMDVLMEDYDENAVDGKVIRGRQWTHEKMINLEACYRLGGVLD